MTSLKEYINKVGTKYLWGSSSDAEPSKSKVTRIAGNKISTTEQLTSGKKLEMYRRILNSEPMVRKAILKKNRDTFKNWFTLKDKTGEPPSQQIIDIVHNFDKKTRFPTLLYESGVCANVYGTGFIEKIYNEYGKTSADSKITPEKKLIDLELLNSENINKRKKRDEKGKIFYPVYNDTKSVSDDKLIHPTRLEVVRIDKLPYSYFGISSIKVLWNILNSKMNADVAAGEFVTWVGRGLFDVTIDNMDDDQEKAAHAELKKHPDYLIHDENYTLDVKNPTHIDPSPFYDYFYTNIAAVIDMPKHMLIGGEMGNVTGSEVGTSAYYSDIENIQRLIFTPIVENIYMELLRSHGKAWKYDISWNPIFVDELSEAKILQTRAYASTQSKNAGIVDTSEARSILNDGIIHLDPDKDIEPPEPEQPAISDPNVEPQPVKKAETRHIKRLTPMQLEMIQRNRLIGEIELIEQDERVKQAGKKK